MSYFNSVLKHLEDKRERAIKGLYNCIPFPFKRFREVMPGTQKGKYLIITANQKIGKTKFCDFVYVFEPLFFMAEHPEIHLKILYFCLEESPRKKYIDFLCHLLFRLDGLKVSSVQLESTDKNHPLDSKILETLKSERYQKYIKLFEETVTYIDDAKNPTGIQKKCWDFASARGKLNYKNITVKGPLGESLEKKMIDPINPFTPDDPEAYWFIILDNFSNLTTESGLNKRETIERMSKYFISLRDTYGYTIIGIQHQAQAQEGIENFKLNKIKPSTDGLADSKVTSRDINLLIGLYSPFKYGIQNYEGYQVTKFKNHIRFMEILEDRDYGANSNICPLYFDGATTFFKELPKAEDTTELEKVYNYMEGKSKRNLFSVLFAMFNGKRYKTK